MNLQTFNSPEEPKKKANKKPIIIGATVAVVLVAAVAIGLLIYQNNASSNDGEEVYIPQYDENGNIDTGIDNDYYNSEGDLRVPDEVVTIPEPEIDYEPAPVEVIYNPEADTNDDGHITKEEWQTWVDAHPEDLDQDLVVTEEEQAEFNGEELPTPEPEQEDEVPIGEIDMDELNKWSQEQASQGWGGSLEDSNHGFDPITVE